MGEQINRQWDGQTDRPVNGYVYSSLGIRIYEIKINAQPSSKVLSSFSQVDEAADYTFEQYMYIVGLLFN